MTSLADQKCIPCQGGIPPMTREKAEEYLARTPGWRVDDEGIRISRHFTFKNFKQALAFANAVGDAAETEGHHPDMTLGWGYVTVVFFTHKIKGLHENDFIMAAKANALHDQADKS